MAPAPESKCKQVADWMPICRQDFAAIVVIVLFILYVLLGVGPTIKAFKWCRAKLSGRASRPEAVSNEAEEGFDPYHSPTLLLKRYLTRNAHTTVPPPTYFPAMPRGLRHCPPPPSQPSLFPSHSTILQEQAQDRLRLSSFRFPSSRRTSAPPQVVPDLFSSSIRSSQCSDETDLDTLNNMALDSCDDKKAYSDDYDEKACDLADERPTRPESTVRLPNIPPPAYLDLDREMEPERYEYPDV